LDGDFREEQGTYANEKMQARRTGKKVTRGCKRFKGCFLGGVRK